MNEKIKKYGKIILIIAVIIIGLAAVGSFVTNITGSALTGYSPNAMPDSLDVDYAADLGLSTSLGEASKSLPFLSKAEESTVQRSANNNAGGQGEGALTQKKIIKNGSLNLYVKDAEKAASQIQALALALDGFVTESNIYKSSDGIKRGNVTIRIPVESFEEAIHNVKQLAEDVDSEGVTSQDVTEQYVDLEAQLRNLRAEEARYLDIMQKSFTIDDTLKVSSRLSDVRGRIERIQGQLQFLSRQVDMSTIRITLSADADIEVFGIRWRPLIVIKRSLKNMLSELADYADAMIAFIFKLPVIILWFITVVVLVLIAVKIVRWIYLKFFKKYFREPDKNE